MRYESQKLHPDRPIVVVGSGYTGLVTAFCFAEMGYKVLCVDKDPAKMSHLKAGRVPIYEQFFSELMARHGNGGVTFTTDLGYATRQAEIVFIALGTSQELDGKTNLSCVEAATIEIARSIDNYTIIVEKDTIPVLANEQISNIVERCGVPRERFDVIYNPEFLRKGNAILDFLHPDRIVIGCNNDLSSRLIEEIYRPLTSGSYYQQPFAIPGKCGLSRPPILLRTSIQSAELIKHASNVFLAMKISFINIIANLCEAIGANITEVGLGTGMDQRIGTQYLHPGIGYGGACLPRDLTALRLLAAEFGIDFSLLNDIEQINELQPVRFLQNVRNALGGFENTHLAVLGLAYKCGTDDVRESPALRLVRRIIAEGGSVAAYDPAAMDRAQTLLRPSEQLRYAIDELDAACGADALLILTDWPQFASLDLNILSKSLRNPLLIDGRNLFRPEDVVQYGLKYLSIGRPTDSICDQTKLSLSSRPHEGIVARDAARFHSAGFQFVRRNKKSLKILLTGAAGFLGSHLTDRLLADGNNVLGVDNLCTGDLRNLAHLTHERRFELIERDICMFFDPGPIDFIFNFASPASPPQYMRLGIDTLRVGSEGTINMLELARKYGAKLLHASTSECYGTPEIHPQLESYWGYVNPVGPRSVYDEAKRFGEAAVMAYRAHHKVDTRLVRIFNTYGPRMQPDDGRVISNFVVQAIRGEDVTVYGDGSHTRSFCYVADLIEGILRLSQKEEVLPVNLGNPTEERVLECAQLVIELTGSTSKIRFEPLPQDDPPRRRPDITKARQLLGWEPKITLNQGLKETIAYFRTLGF